MVFPYQCGRSYGDMANGERRMVAPLASTALTEKLYLPAGATVVPSSSTPSQVSGWVPAVVAPRSMVLTTLPLLSVILTLASAAAVPGVTLSTAATDAKVKITDSSGKVVKTMDL